MRSFFLNKLGEHQRFEGMEKGMKKVVIFTLPEELILEIFLRLPVRSLVRFKCVCKSWRSLISDPQFGESHFDLATAKPTYRLLRTLSQMAFEASLSVTDDSDVVRLQSPPPPPPPPCTGPRYRFDVPCRYYDDYLQTVGYCRGIVLLANINSHVFVWNPSTGAHRQVPISYDELHPDHTNGVHMLSHTILHGFGYDKSTHDYLLVLIRYAAHEFDDEFDDEGVENPNLYPRIQVFSLKTNVPSFICGDFEYKACVDFEYKVFGTGGLFLNQSLHWLVRSETTGHPLVLAFDLVDRSFSEIALSLECVELSRDKQCRLRVPEGRLGLYYWDGAGDDEIWIMEEYKVSSSWTRYFAEPPTKSFACCRFVPVCFTRDGALLASSGEGKIIELNDNGEVLEYHQSGLKSNNLPRHRYVYRESLLPLP